MIFYRDANSALLQLVSQWSNFTYNTQVLTLSRYGRKNTTKIMVFTRIELTTTALVGVRGYLLDHSGDEGQMDVGSIGVVVVVRWT